jgi:phage shock protein E
LKLYLKSVSNMRIIVLLVLAFWSFTACTDTPQVQHLSIEAFKQTLDTTPEKVLVDVRTDAEVAGGMIPGAIQIDIQGNDLDQRIDNLDKTQPVFVYCAMGARSSAMASLLAQKGFTKIYNAESGINGWKAAGFPITPHD